MLTGGCSGETTPGWFGMFTEGAGETTPGWFGIFGEATPGWFGIFGETTPGWFGIITDGCGTLVFGSSGKNGETAVAAAFVNVQLAVWPSARVTLNVPATASAVTDAAGMPVHVMAVTSQSAMSCSAKVNVPTPRLMNSASSLAPSSMRVSELSASPRFALRVKTASGPAVSPSQSLVRRMLPEPGSGSSSSSGVLV